ncbi:MAG TPA: serine/threonine-protein kinase [Pirellulaceae bacterium]|nr:serine/threonine-protein kinase [Pirellulaceae bacterium]
MADSVTRRTTIEATGSTAALTGTTAPVGQEFALAPEITSAQRASDSAVGDSAHGDSPSTRTRAAVVIDEQKTVISKKPPLSEPVVLQRTSTPAEMGRILVGERLSHFELEEFVGGGGMGAVFRAIDTMLNRTVAVKVLSCDQTDEETLKRFKNEAQNAARLDHEKIARVYYVGEDKGWHYIVFEYIDGVNVRDLVDDKGPLALDEAISYTLQVAEALRHAYRRDVVHRDIKPSNILVMLDGRAKLVDMGLARLHQVESPQNDLTASGVTLGTFDYISPEQARDPRNADVRSDIYSLGCTLYYMLTGRPLFPDGTVLQKLLSHSTDPPPDPRLFRPDIPDEICRILTKMLAKNPSQRYQSPDELITELLALADQLGLESSARSGTSYVTRPNVPTPWYERHLPWAAPVVTLVVVILLLDWFASPGRDGFELPRPNLLPAANRAPDLPAPRPPIPTDKPQRETPAVSSSAGTKSPSETSPPTEAVAVTPLPASGAKTPETPTAPTTKPAPANDGELAGGTIEPFQGGGVAEPPVVGGVDAATAGVSALAPAASGKVRILAVGPSNAPHAAHVKVMPSLATACAAAASYPDLEAIELHFDDERVEEPFELAATAVTIRAAAGRTPVVVFRPATDTLAAERHMLRLVGGRVTFQGIQFRLELPTEHAGDGWSLFALDQVRSLEMERCCLTIRNATELGAVLQSNVAFLELLNSPVMNETSTTEAVTMLVPPLVQLTASVARGEATFIRAEFGTPFTLRWNQGLLATTQRLADIGGASNDQIWDSWVRIDLSHVTAAVREGLCIMRSRPDASKHLALEIDAAHCIFITDTTSALLEHQTLDTVERLKTKHPEFTGRGNIFSGPREFWRIVSQRSSEPTEPTFGVGFNVEEPTYGFTEPVLLKAVMWKALPSPTRPPHTYLKSDYLLSDDPANPALRRGEDIAGFDPAVVPEFHGETKLLVPAPLPMSDAVRAEPMETPTPEKQPTSSGGVELKTPEMRTPVMREPPMRETEPRDPIMTTPTIPPRS